MIETEALTKSYGSLTAVDNLTFTVTAGQVLGFLGPNGAGKSTTMKMLAGFLTPSSGKASICGFDVEAEPVEAKKRIGYLPEGAPAYGEMTPAGFLEFVADIRELEGPHRAQRLDEVIQRLHLDRVLHQPIETLSKGYKRRVGLAQAILHDPRVLILDEPTDGLDPNQKHEVRGLIREMAADKIIVVSTHILEEVHAVCNRAIIIAGGRILADDTPAALEARSPRHRAIRLALPEPVRAAAAEAVGQIDGVASVEQQDDGLVVVPAGDAVILPEIGRVALSQGWDVSELQVQTGQLDEVFRQITTSDATGVRA
jgi:ABC-2 type transport system ATP-binding protein